MENEERIYIKENLDLRETIKKLNKDINFLNKDNQKLFKECQDRKEVEESLMKEVHRRDKEVRELENKNFGWLERCRRFRKRDAKEFEAEKKELEAKLEEARYLMQKILEYPISYIFRKLIYDFLNPIDPEPKPDESLITKTEQDRLDAFAYATGERQFDKPVESEIE